jgi:hypothetical protein
VVRAVGFNISVAIETESLNAANSKHFYYFTSMPELRRAYEISPDYAFLDVFGQVILSLPGVLHFMFESLPIRKHPLFMCTA